MFRYLLALMTIAGVEAAGAQPAPGTSETYDLVSAHLCEDAEYLSCLEVSAGQCRQDLASAPLQRCGQGFYVYRVQPGQDPAPRSIPTGMIECIYAAHIELRGLDASEVHTCMSQAKLRN